MSALPAVWADANRVTQILTNLISNAHKYTLVEWQHHGSSSAKRWVRARGGQR